MSDASGMRRAGALGIHSIDHFCLEVPDLAEARRFYGTFGLDVRDEGAGLALYTHGHPHRWGIILPGKAKRLAYLSFGIYEEDAAAFERHLTMCEAKRIAPPKGTDEQGIWIDGFDGLLLNIRVAEKSSPAEKATLEVTSVGPGQAGCASHGAAARVEPRRLSHFAIFTTSVSAAIGYYGSLLGLRLSDRSGELVAFLHGPHGSDHHMLALVGSDHCGMHHVSWDVRSFHEVGLGSAQMARAGYAGGWGVGRHVLGANYFFYVRDPWGSYSEYSADIDYIPADCDWPAADHPPEDSMYLWGPPPPKDFIENFEPRERSA